MLREGNSLPTAVLLPGKCHGQRSLAGYSPWGHKQSDTTEEDINMYYVYLYITHTLEVCNQNLFYKVAKSKNVWETIN